MNQGGQDGAEGSDLSNFRGLEQLRHAFGSSQVISQNVQSHSHSQQQNVPSHSHSQQQNVPSHSHSEQQLNGGGIGRGVPGLDFPSMHQQDLSMSSLLSMGHGYNDSSRYMRPGVGGLDNNSNRLVSDSVIMKAIESFHQSIGRLQVLLPLLAQNQGHSSALVQQQAAGVMDILSQFAIPDASMLPNIPDPQTNMSMPQLGQHLGTTNSGHNLFPQPEQAHSSSAIVRNTGNTFPEGVVEIENSGNSVASGLFVTAGSSLGGAQLSGVGSGSALGRQDFGLLDGRTSGVGMHCKPGAVNNSPLGSDDQSYVSRKRSIGEMMNRTCDESKSAIRIPLDDHDLGGISREDDDDGESENLPPESYELVEMHPMEILAEHTHFCEICGKGFKRDANLRMHMRGHGDEYKTAGALSRPDKVLHDPSLEKSKRFCCPYVGCKRNKMHKKFQPLKTMLCVKNHYRRSHCPKVLVCTKCNSKKFSVVADLKTHEKHCGREKWQCSCGTTFSRKDKLYGHVSLFTGHTPASPLLEMDASGVDLDSAETMGGNGTPRGISSPSSSRFTAANALSLDSGDAEKTLGMTGLEGMSSRGGHCSSLSNEVNGKLSGPDNSTQSEFPETDNLLSGSSMSNHLFPTPFLSEADQSTDVFQ